MRLAPLFRYRMAAGLRRAATSWSGAIMAVVVAGAIQTPPPFAGWAMSWGRATYAGRAAACLLVLLVFLSAARSQLRKVILGDADTALRVLPVPPRSRFALDWASSAAFLSAPIVALSGLALYGDIALGRSAAQSAGTLGLAAAAMITATTFTLYDRRSVAIALAGAAAVGFSAMPPILAVAPATAGAVLTWFIARRSNTFPEDAETATAARGETRAPLVSNAFINLTLAEARWLRRCRAPMLTMYALAMALLACGALATANNHVTNPLSLVRIWTLFSAAAAGVLAYPIARARISSARFRIHEELLPVSREMTLASGILVAWIVATPLVALAAFLTHDAVITAGCAFTVFALVAVLRADAESAARVQRRTEAPFWLSVTFTALAMALHPTAGVAFLVTLAFLARGSVRASSRYDFPRHAVEEMS